MIHLYSSGLLLVLAFVISELLTLTVAQSNSNIVFELQEEQKANTFVGNVAHASGIQSEIAPAELRNLRYQILSSDGLRISSLFTINSSTGLLFTNAMIDREHVCDSSVVVCRLQFDVTVKLDVAVLKILHVAVVIQDVNDNAPSFPVKVLRQNISEASPKESDFSIPSAVDFDAQLDTEITYWIEDHQIFGLREEKLLGVSLLKVVLLQDLDREKKSEYQLNIYAKDGNTSSALTGTLSVVVTVTDANDNSPQFAQSVFNFTVSEDAETGSWVGNIHASDLDTGENGRITFQFSSLTSSRVLQLFDLNADTANVTVKSGLQYESGETFQAVVVAKDHGGSPKASQAILIINIIDVGNTPPKLSLILVDPVNQNSTILSEDLPVSYFVGTLRYQDTDTGDNGAVECMSLNLHFALAPLEESGYAIKIKVPLDREAESEVTVVLKCSDGGIPSLSTYVNFTVRVLDVNDNRPVFKESEYSSSVKEGELSQRNLLQVSATDADEGMNREVTYQLTMNTSNSFSIDPFTGWISLIAPLDREIESVVRLNVEAVDKGQPPLTGSVTVTIFVEDINDNTPEITRTVYVVKENQEPGAFVAQIITADSDDGINARLQFHLMSDAFTGFRVSEEGVITTNEVFDRETIDHYIIVVSVADMGNPSLTSTSTLTIDITDTNDHSPQISYPRPGNDSITISASLSPGVAIAKINATDSDLDKNAKLVYLIAEGNLHQIFGIDNATGTIFLAKSLTTNRESNYRLTISVQDGGSPRLHNNTFLHINIDFTNVTIVDTASEMEQKYIIIAGIIAGITVVIAVILIAIIIKIRRIEPDRCLEPGLKSKHINLVHSGTKVFSEVNVLEASAFKVGPTNKEVGSGDEKDKGRDPNSSFDSSLTNGSVPTSYRPSLTRELLDRQGRQRLTSEDIHSDTSADASTSDSGKGTSDGEDASGGASPPPTIHSGAIISKISAPRAPSTDSGIVLHGNERRNLALMISPDSGSFDESTSPSDYSSQKEFDKMRRTPNKVRFSFDYHIEDNNNRLNRSKFPVGLHAASALQPYHRPVRLYPDVLTGPRLEQPRQSGGQFLLHRNHNEPIHRGLFNTHEPRHASRGELSTTNNVPLSMDALAKHNLLQAGSKQKQAPYTNHHFLIPQHISNHQQNGHLGVVNQSADEDDDNNSTTTSGSYIVDGMDDTVSASVEC